MDMSSADSSMTMTMNGMMVPWLHFTGGDNLLFEAWSPSSPGTIAGACIGLVVFALLERWVNAMRGVLEARWRKRYALGTLIDWQRLTSPGSRAVALMSSTSTSAPSDVACHTSSSPSLQAGSSKEVQEVKIGAVPAQKPVRSQRTLPPFIASHDIPRGALFAFQSLLFYILMLAVMCVPLAPLR